MQPARHPALRAPVLLECAWELSARVYSLLRLDCMCHKCIRIPFQGWECANGEKKILQITDLCPKVPVSLLY